MKFKTLVILASSLCASTSAFAESNSIQYRGHSLLINMATGQGIAVWGNSVDNGSPVIQYTATAKSNHLVRFIPTQGSRYMIQFASSGKCVSLNGFSSVVNRNFVQWNCIDGDTQAFMVVPHSDNTISLRVRTSDQCLTGGFGSPAPGYNMVQQPCLPGNTYQKYYVINVAE